MLLKSNILALSGCETPQRFSNFELLRIVCMLLIICGHVIMLHEYGEVGDSSWYIGQIVRPFCMVAVNVFVLISGYFGINLNYKKLLKINWMVTFYCVFFLIITLLIGIHTFNPRTDWMQFVPVVTRQYWFITVYITLCLISPYLNLLVDKLDKLIFERMLIALFWVFCILPTLGNILNFQSVTNDAGYGLVNFVFLYMLGRYLKLYYIPKKKRSFYLMVYCGSMFMLAIFQIIYSKLLNFSFDALISYDTIFVMIGGVNLFLYFSQLTFTNKVINSLALPCLAVYVIHLNPLFCEYLFFEILRVRLFTGWGYVICLVILPCMLYLVCYAIELCRLKLFGIFINK